MKRLEVWIILMIVVITAGITYAFRDKVFRPTEEFKNTTYEVKNRWALPTVLEEVSGVVWLENGVFATVEDEDAVIFIYNTQTNKMVQEIIFGEYGDFEALAIASDDAYVMRSDGVLFEIIDYRAKDLKINKYKTGFKGKNNIESMAYDASNNRLLITPKDEDLHEDNYKGIYAYDLKEHQLNKEAVFKIDFNNEAFKEYNDGDSYETFRPSDIGIHPKTGDIYILEGRDPKLVVLNKKGEFKQMHILDTDDFPQPEGITFSDAGNIYISNEGAGGSGTIVEAQFFEETQNSESVEDTSQESDKNKDKEEN